MSNNLLIGNNIHLTINKIIDGGKDLVKGSTVSRGQAIDYAFDIALKTAKEQAARSFTLEQIDELFFPDNGNGYFDEYLNYKIGDGEEFNEITFKEWFNKYKGDTIQK